MKITLASVTLLAGLVAAPAAALAAPKEYKATINDAQESSCTTLASKATGTAALTFDVDTGELTGTVTFVPNGDLVGVDMVHFHDGTCGKSGGINGAAGLDNPSGNIITVNETVAMPKRADFGKALDDGALYINVHTTACSGGEIRGQVYPKASTETCPPSTATDGGTEAGTSSSGGSSGTTSSSGGSSSGGSSGGSSGATTERADSGTEAAAAPADDGGCSTSGADGSSMNGVLVALGAGIALTGIARGRRKKR